MYRFNAEHPGQSLYIPTIIGVIIGQVLEYMFCKMIMIMNLNVHREIHDCACNVLNMYT